LSRPVGSAALGKPESRDGPDRRFGARISQVYEANPRRKTGPKAHLPGTKVLMFKINGDIKLGSRKHLLRKHNVE